MKKLVIISLLLTLIACNDYSNEFLYAFREAPIGGEFLRLKDSINFEYGYIRTKEISKGKYIIKNDSLILSYSVKHHEGVPSLFIFQNDYLIPIDKKAAILEIMVNRIYTRPKTSEELFQDKYGIKINK